MTSPLIVPLALTLALLIAFVLPWAHPAHAVPLNWEQAQQWYEHGLRLEKDDFTGNAIILFREIMSGYPEHFNTRMALARLLLPRDADEALIHLIAARSLRPTSASVHYMIGNALERQNRLLEAAEAYRKTIFLNAKHATANLRLQALLKKLRSGLSTVEQAAEYFWSYPSIASLTLFGRVIMRDAEPLQALLEFESLRQRLPQLPEVYLWIARANRRLGNAPDEIRAYSAYLETNKRAVGVRLTLAERLIGQARYRTALEALQALDGGAGSTQPSLEIAEQGRHSYLISRIHSGLGRQSAATDSLLDAFAKSAPKALVNTAFEQDVARRPTSHTLRMRFGRWLQNSGDPVKAIGQYRVPCLSDLALRQDCAQIFGSLIGNRAASEYARLALGELALVHDDEQEAIDHLSRISPNHPAETRASLKLGMIYRRRGDIENTIDAFTRYIFSFPDRTGVNFARANLFWERGARDKAIEIWMGQPETLRGRKSTLHELADYLEQQAQTARELTVRIMLRDADPGALKNRLRLGTLLLAKGREQEATLEWQAVLAAGFGNFGIMIDIGRTMLGLGHHEQALQALWQASQLQPLDEAMSAGLADSLSAAGRYDEALQVYWQLYRTNPQNPKPHKAIPELVRLVPTSVPRRMEAAQMADKAGNSKQAVELLEELLNIDGSHVPAQRMLARLLLAHGSAAQAERILTQWSGRPNDLERLTMLAEAQRQQGRIEELLNTLGRLRIYDPDNPRYDRMHGLLLAQRGRMTEAAPMLEKTLAGDADDQEVRVYLARHDAKSRRFDQAVDHYEILLRDNPGHVEFTRELTRVYIAAERWEPLVALLERRLEKNSGDTDARYTLVSTLLGEYKAKQARPHYEILKAEAPSRARQFAPYFR